MASPTFFSNGHTPRVQDRRAIILQKILGALTDLGATNVNPSFFSEGHTPLVHDPEEVTLQKILGAIIDNVPGGGGGGGGSGSVMQGAADPPSNTLNKPTDPTKPAIYYPTGGGTLYQWDVGSQTWK